MLHNMDFQERINEQIDENRSFIETDPYRLGYHLMPPVGLLNDPNGLIQFQGVFHVFFQWNPFETKHGRKFWGHYTSEDLIHWTLEPVALMPDSWYDKNGCYSGSAIEHEGTMYLFYTGNVKDENDVRSSYQSLAISEDGMNFEKKGPVLHLPEGYTPHFRDPKVWKEEDHWLMVLGAQNDQEQGEAVLARSPNLMDWEFIGPIAGSGMNSLGDFGYMWECPDLFQLDGTDVLIVCPQGLKAQGDDYQNLYQAGYFLGDFDPTEAEYTHGSFEEFDRGFDFYAPQTMLDEKGRRLLIGWMGITDDAEQNQPTIDSNWIHALTIPRVLEIKDGKLIQTAVPELQKLRGRSAEYEVVLEAGDAFSEEINACSEILIDFKNTAAGKVELEIRNDIRISYKDNRFVVERYQFSGTEREQRAFALDQLTGLQIFLDHSSMEIFINGGEEVFTCRYFPDPEDNTIALQAEKKMTLDIHHWPLNGGGSITF
ncbi:glycoside hydrolase family 32 protein [Salinicoccus sp. HZC-1]|uniref:glycoside hydrolase family 32 protein n=1 Tax=Salinicoccus sp. HZC-1 TaxID=3385497 RepID=UPI00398AA8BF